MPPLPQRSSSEKSPSDASALYWLTVALSKVALMPAAFSELTASATSFA